MILRDETGQYAPIQKEKQEMNKASCGKWYILRGVSNNLDLNLSIIILSHLSVVLLRHTQERSDI